MKGLKIITRRIIYGNKGHSAQNKLKPHVAEMKNKRRSYPTDIEDELGASQYTLPNRLKREIAATQRRGRKAGLPLPDIGDTRRKKGENIVHANPAEKYTTKRIRQRMREQIQRGREQAGKGILTIEMERFLNKHGVFIEGRPQKWQLHRKEAF